MSTEPRERNADATRQDILSAARRLFAASSFEHVGMRDIAREAGINVALVSRYFGSKEELFRKVLLERPDTAWFGNRTTLPALAEWLAALALPEDTERHNSDLERLSIILNSHATPATADMISRAFVADVFDPLAVQLGEEHPRVRAGLALVLVIGTTVLNGILSAEATSPEERDEGRRRLHALIAQALMPY